LKGRAAVKKLRLWDDIIKMNLKDTVLVLILLPKIGEKLEFGKRQ